MPGELGNEEDQQGVGYYEHRYSPDNPEVHPDNSDEKPRGAQILRVIKKMREQES